ncbi:hypothetical protein Tco_1556016, partial [Tanacetum coccineum]
TQRTLYGDGGVEMVAWAAGDEVVMAYGGVVAARVMREVGWFGVADVVCRMVVVVDGCSGCAVRWCKMERECWWWEWCHKRMEMKAVYGIGGSIKVMLARLIVVTGWVGRLEIDVRLLVVVVGVATLVVWQP